MPAPPEQLLPTIYDLGPEDLKAELQKLGAPAFRATQILEWVYRKRAESFDEMSNVPKPLRWDLADRFSLVPATPVLTKASSDVTEKLLLQLRDGAMVETVLIRHPQQGVGVEESRKTICVSSQVGCAYGCRFCASGLAGFRRNLSQGEILAQIAHVCRLEDARQGGPAEHVPFDNLVFMGMGEPLANYDAVVGAIRAINADWGFRFGARRITVSTSGLVPQIHMLAKEPIQFRLAISLHGATNEVRSRIMPINRRYPLETLLPAAEQFAELHGRMITLEYILIEEVNDTLEQAEELREIATRLHAHVNLIPYNRVEGLSWKRPSMKRQQAFANILRDARVSLTIRKEKGDDIDAACGQLRLREEPV